jgi:hypothetical protein
MRLGGCVCVCVFASSKGYLRMRQGEGQARGPRISRIFFAGATLLLLTLQGKKSLHFIERRGYCCGRALTSKRAERVWAWPERVMMHGRRAQLSTHGAKVSLLLQFDTAGVRSETLFLHCN